MSIGKSALGIGLAVLAAALAACGSPNTPVPTSTPIHAAQVPTVAATARPTAAPAATQPTGTPAGGCANAYFPASNGAVWSYASTGGIAGAYSYGRILSNVTDNGFTTRDTFSTGNTRTLKWSCDGGNLTSVPSGGGTGGVSGGSTVVTIDSVSTTGYQVPADFSDGKAWTEDLTTNGTLTIAGAKKGTSTGQTHTSCATGGADTITVKAGTFDTIKVTCHSDTSTVATVDGVTTDPVKTSMDSTLWYAKGVGVVKSVNSGDGGNETIQLTHYAAP